MRDIVFTILTVVSGSLLLYWFWPGPALCVECGSELDSFCFCTNEECVYNLQQQEFVLDERKDVHD